MNIKAFYIAAIVATGLFFTSCNNDDKQIAKPEISLDELGTGNSKIGIIGSDLHVEAEIVAEGTIDKVKVEIHPEGTGTWEFDSIYTEFSGKKNCTFHKHIDIHATALDTGAYHLHLIVTDMLGNETTEQAELEIQAPSDATAPVISVATSPTTNQSFSNGETISISGSVSDDIALGGLYIGLVREGQNLTDAEVDATNTITILHAHDFDYPNSSDFSASITVGAAQDNNISPKDITGDIAWQSANYYIVVKCKDEFGGNWTYSTHYPLVINY